MKYTVKGILNTGKPVKYLLFWGHQKQRDGSISKSCLSQWWEADFVIDGLKYRSSEHYMMAEKARLFSDELRLEKILNCRSAAEAKKLGRQVEGFNQSIWEDHRYDIVKRGNLYKFSQNIELKEFLLQTKNRILVEASPVDSIWGIGLASDDNNAMNPKKWRGLNLLGFALMEVRDEIQSLK